MRTMKFSLLLLSLFLILTSCEEKEFFLVNGGKAKTRIVIPTKATDIELKAASTLQDYIEQISGVKLRIVTDNKWERNNEILLGNVKRYMLDTLDLEPLQKDGFILRAKNKKLMIAGGTEKGTLYGVYAFLEDYLDCRKYSSKVSVIPKKESIKLEKIDTLQVPAFKYRETHYRDTYDPNFMEWHALDSHRADDQDSDWGLWCHTNFSLVSPEIYGESNPEYFSMIDGKRTLDNSDICLSNPEVFEIAYNSLKELIEAKPEVSYWSVSQMDNNRYCRCPECSKANEKAGGPMGTILPFTNKMARKFPDKIISTLSYWYSTKPPKDIVPEKNVNIMLCNIGSPRHIPIQQGDPNFCKDLEGWNKLTDNILLWDYIVNFSHLISPFPNLRTLQPNLQYLNSNSVVAMFEQGNREIGGEFCELRAYLLSKLMWNPSIDINEVMNDFLNGYYGAAGKDIRAYIDLLHDEMERTEAKLSIFGKPSEAMETFLSEEMMVRYDEIFDKAELAVANDPEVLFRVQTARVPLNYSKLAIAKEQILGDRGAFFTDTDGSIKPKPEIINILNGVIDNCLKNGVTRVHEWHTTPTEYFDQYQKFLNDNSSL
jgi:hypothetical protein